MQINKQSFLVCTILLLIGNSESVLAQQQANEDVRSMPINKQLEIDRTASEFRKAYIEYSVDPEESRRYLKMVRSNRELSQKVQERALVLKLNEQQIELTKQQNQLKQLENAGQADKSPEKPVELNLTSFVAEKKTPEVIPTLQSIDNGKVAVFLVGNELGRFSAGDSLPNGEVIQSVSLEKVVLMSNGRKRTVYGMPLGE